MEVSISQFLSSLSSSVFRVAAMVFLLANSAAIVVFATTRSRQLVNSWTPRLVTLDAILVGTGLGVPLLAALAKLGVHALAGIAAGAVALFK